MLKMQTNGQTKSTCNIQSECFIYEWHSYAEICLWHLPLVFINYSDMLFQAPSSMKAVVQAAWLLTIAFGNLIVIIVAETKSRTLDQVVHKDLTVE